MAETENSVSSKKLELDGDQGERQEDVENGIALCLSGGGFRATLYHLGVVRYLCLSGKLKNVKIVSSVSGGSVLAAHLVLHWHKYLEKNWAVESEGCSLRWNTTGQCESPTAQDEHANCIHPTSDLLSFVRRGARSHATKMVTWWLPLAVILTIAALFIIFSDFGFNVDEKIRDFIGSLFKESINGQDKTEKIQASGLANFISFLGTNWKDLLIGTSASLISFLLLILTCWGGVSIWAIAWRRNTRRLWKRLNSQLFTATKFSELNTIPKLYLNSKDLVTGAFCAFSNASPSLLSKNTERTMRKSDIMGAQIHGSFEDAQIPIADISVAGGVCASAAFPQVFQPYQFGIEKGSQLNDLQFTDGGVHDNSGFALLGYLQETIESSRLNNVRLALLELIHIQPAGNYREKQLLDDLFSGIYSDLIDPDRDAWVTTMEKLSQIAIAEFPESIRSEVDSLCAEINRLLIHSPRTYVEFSKVATEVIVSNSATSFKKGESYDYNKIFRRLPRVLEMVTRRLEFLQVSIPFTDINFSNRVRFLSLSREDPDDYPDTQKRIRNKLRTARTDFNSFSEIEIVHLVQAGFDDAAGEFGALSDLNPPFYCLAPHHQETPDLSVQQLKYVSKRDLGIMLPRIPIPVFPPISKSEISEALRREGKSYFFLLFLNRIATFLSLVVFVSFVGVMVFDDFLDSMRSHELTILSPPEKTVIETPGDEGSGTIGRVTELTRRITSLNDEILDLKSQIAREEEKFNSAKVSWEGIESELQSKLTNFRIFEKSGTTGYLAIGELKNGEIQPFTTVKLNRGIDKVNSVLEVKEVKLRDKPSKAFGKSKGMLVGENSDDYAIVRVVSIVEDLIEGHKWIQVEVVKGRLDE